MRAWRRAIISAILITSYRAIIPHHVTSHRIVSSHRAYVVWRSCWGCTNLSRVRAGSDQRQASSHHRRQERGLQLAQCQCGAWEAVDITTYATGPSYPSNNFLFTFIFFKLQGWLRAAGGTTASHGTWHMLTVV